MLNKFLYLSIWIPEPSDIHNLAPAKGGDHRCRYLHGTLVICLYHLHNSLEMYRGSIWIKSINLLRNPVGLKSNNQHDALTRVLNRSVTLLEQLFRCVGCWLNLFLIASLMTVLFCCLLTLWYLTYSWNKMTAQWKQNNLNISIMNYLLAVT